MGSLFRIDFHNNRQWLFRAFTSCSDSSHVTCCLASFRGSLKTFRRNFRTPLAPFMTPKPPPHRKLPHLATWLEWTLGPSDHNCSSFCAQLLSRSRKLKPFSFTSWKLARGNPWHLFVLVQSWRPLPDCAIINSYSLSSSTCLGCNISFLVLFFSPNCIFSIFCLTAHFHYGPG